MKFYLVKEINNMKKVISFFGLMLALVVHIHAQQKVVAECTVDFMAKTTDADEDLQKSVSNTTQNWYFKANQSRIDNTSPEYKQTELYDAKTNTMTVLQEFGNSKFMSILDSKKLKEKYKMYDGATIATSLETKTILGYNCKKVVLKLTNGQEYNIFYASEITPSVKEYQPQFKDVPGFVLEYEAVGANGKSKITYTATKFSLSPVSPARFEVPKSGYRILP
jgi:GLPGLI family protein